MIHKLYDDTEGARYSECEGVCQFESLSSISVQRHIVNTKFDGRKYVSNFCFGNIDS